MPTSPSYKKSTCCGGQDCDFLDEFPGEQCWGQVELDSPGDDEDGWPICGHLCQGHRHAYGWPCGEPTEYIPEQFAQTLLSGGHLTFTSDPNK